MWAGDGRGATPMHYDRNDNFLSWVSRVQGVLWIVKGPRVRSQGLK